MSKPRRIVGCTNSLIARGMCSAHYRRWKLHGDPLIGGRPSGEKSKCSVDGCERARKSHTAKFCNIHYNRVWRKGSPDDIVAQPERLHSDGYVIEYRPRHRLAAMGSPNEVYQHRRVYYDAHGEGPFSCHWCSSDLTWETMDVDHLDDVKNHNDPDNLVASCPGCNRRRAGDRATVGKRRTGHLVTALGQTRCLAEWARDIGISASALGARLGSGWTPERAVSEPRGVCGPRAKQPVL